MYRVTFYNYPRGQGILIPTPPLPDKNVNDTFMISWLIYEKVSASHSLFKHDLNQSKKNVAPNAMPEIYLQYFYNKIANEFPSFARDLFLKTKCPFIQSIYDTLVPNYYRNNICLIGDASILLRPHTASGATKALQDAFALEKSKPPIIPPK